MAASSAAARRQTKPTRDDEEPRGLRHFARVSIEPGSAPIGIDGIADIVPRLDGEAWVLAKERHGDVALLFHLARPAMAPPAETIFIGSETDQRNEVRNSRAPLRWVGHCDFVFVALAKQRPDGSFTSTGVWAREKALAALVNDASGKGPMPDAALVEGALGGRRVAGVLVWRGLPDRSGELVEKVASAIVADEAARSGWTPEATCTAPVLERASLLRR